MNAVTPKHLESWLEDKRGAEPGMVIMGTGGAIATSNQRAFQLLNCANTEEMRLLVQPVVKRLAASSSEAALGGQQFELHVRERLQTRRIMVTAHALGTDHLRWLLLLYPEEQARGRDQVLQNSARNELLGRLHGTVRHDLNSPIQALLWTFDLLQKAAHQAEMPAEQRSQIDETASMGRKELARLKNAVRRFLSFALVESEEPERLDLKEVLEEVHRVLAAEASLFDVRVNLELPPQDLFVKGRRGQLEQAIAALVLNAVDSAPAGKCVTVVLEAQAGNAVIVVHSAPVVREIETRPLALPARAPVPLHAAHAIAAQHGGDINERVH